MPRYQVERTVDFPVEPIFDLIADVERYPEFLSGWIRATIRKHESCAYYTDQTVQLGPMRVRFGSRTELHRPARIEVQSQDWPFRELRLVWHLEPLTSSSCRLALNARMECRSAVASHLLEHMLPSLACDIMSCFERRAHQVLSDRE